MTVGQPKFTRENITSSSQYNQTVLNTKIAFGVNVAKFVKATPSQRSASSGVASQVLESLNLDNPTVSADHPFQTQLNSPRKSVSIPARLAVDLNTETMEVDKALKALVRSGKFADPNATEFANHVLGLLRVAQQMQVSGEGLNQFEKLVGDRTKVSIHEAIDSGFTQTPQGEETNNGFASKVGPL